MATKSQTGEPELEQSSSGVAAPGVSCTTADADGSRSISGYENRGQVWNCAGGPGAKEWLFLSSL